MFSLSLLFYRSSDLRLALAEPLFNELIVCAVLLHVCEAGVELLKELSIAFLYRICELFVIAERVTCELSDI